MTQPGTGHVFKLTCTLLFTLIWGGQTMGQSSSLDVAASSPVSVSTAGIGTGGGGTTSGGSGTVGSSHRPYRTIVNLYWDQIPTTVINRRTAGAHAHVIPPARRGTAAPVLISTLGQANASSGLSTAMPGWKIASSVYPSTTIPTTGHSTYLPPPAMSTYDVIPARRSFSYGISVIRGY